MKYGQFSRKDNIINKILARLGILVTEKIIIKIDHHPDYRISQYRGEEETTYYFNNSWNFENKYSSVVNINVIDKYIFHYDNFKHLSSEYGISFLGYNECGFLQDVMEEHPDAFEEHSFGTETDNFTFNSLNIKTVDNLKHRVYYDGSFDGTSYEISPTDWGVYSILDVIAINIDIDEMPFYKSLLAESYLLLKEKKYKLSHFILYSAFENFINFELDAQDREDRLKDKLNELFCSKFPNLGIHQIYTSTVDLFDNYTIERNAIAHGRGRLDVNEQMVEKSFIFVLTLMSSYSLHSSKFEDLYTKIST
ncbi:MULTISPECIES: hypothetical protein [Chryseobacterium]|uniref:Apea-like HEPN domain-containing protein n=1 Tax=Chryseobacterium aquaticum subsp. greenlandense TaxID=345663 RepID=A0A101CHI5_9FLAO|nr:MULTISPECIES: hypothetical protein [Chryseobacterium]KNB61179.1 hypothetical protein AC804_11380 [Chryseobacterium sp. Hurlbut01]KUJ56376.1 hypothetical protein AR686_07380 [Chryseobacterium aquaticum subsp. greenlandense]